MTSYQLELETHPDMSPNEYMVPMEELRQIWDDCHKRGINHNGMTSSELAKRYPGRVRHIIGFGWVVQS